MDANWVAAIASVASAVVVAVTAVAAFLQIRHVRNANEITVYLRFADRIDSLETGVAFAKIDAFVERMRNDPVFRLLLSQSGPMQEFQDIESLLRFIEHFSTLVITGGISERLFLAEYADNIEQLWSRLNEVIYLRRIAQGPYVCAAFEHLAMRAKRYVMRGEMQRLYGSLMRDPCMSNFTPPSSDIAKRST